MPVGLVAFTREEFPVCAAVQYTSIADVWAYGGRFRCQSV